MTPTFTTFQEFRKRYPIQFADKGTWLGSGTYGKVFRVEDQLETEWVAVKISEYRQNDTKSLKAEVELAQKVPRHANIARYDACYRLETDTGISDFAVMKYYSDGNLADLLKRHKLTNKELRDIVRGTLEGLKHLHQQRIVHRDFKPANILISRDNSGRFIPKIADFGLSKLVSQDEIDSSDFDLSDGRGTPSYKAPEQIEGGRVSFNLDLWAFGVILYEMLTGEKPFSVGTQSSEPTLRREIERKITSAQLPDRLRTLAEPYQSMIRRCLVKDIRQRVRKADELLGMLKAADTQQPLPIVLPKVAPPKTEPEIETATDVYAPGFAETPPPRLPPPPNNAWLWQLGRGVLIVLLAVGFWLKIKPEPIDNQPTTIVEEPQKEGTSKLNAAPPKVEQKQNYKEEKQKKEPSEADKVQIAQQKGADEKRKQEALEENKQKQAALEKQKAQQEYDDLIEKGITSISSNNNKTAAINYFNQASQLANDNGLITSKAGNAYGVYIAKGDRIYANDDPEGAKIWYQVAQSLRNTEEVHRKIRQCN